MTQRNYFQRVIVNLKDMLYRGLRIGFNGLCALASVNHQHVHAWYINHQLYTENAVPFLILLQNLDSYLNSNIKTLVVGFNL